MNVPSVGHTRKEGRAHSTHIKRGFLIQSGQAGWGKLWSSRSAKTFRKNLVVLIARA